MTHVLRQIGWQASQLAGGYKSFRRAVVTQIDAYAGRFRYVVLCGETGSGKSRLLEALTVHGEQVLDLEALACHRGSVLGRLPQTPQPSQKRFETQLWDNLRGLDPGRPVYVEAESKKIGALRVPDALMEAIRNAECVRLQVSLTERVRFLLDEYDFFVDDPVRLMQQLDCLRPLYGNETIARWSAQVAAEEWQALVTELLTAHYDPLYRRSTQRNFVRLQDAAHLNLPALTATELRSAAAELAASGMPAISQ